MGTGSWVCLTYRCLLGVGGSIPSCLSPTPMVPSTFFKSLFQHSLPHSCVTTRYLPSSLAPSALSPTGGWKMGMGGRGHFGLNLCHFFLTAIFCLSFPSPENWQHLRPAALPLKKETVSVAGSRQRAQDDPEGTGSTPGSWQLPHHRITPNEMRFPLQNRDPSDGNLPQMRSGVSQACSGLTAWRSHSKTGPM